MKWEYRITLFESEGPHNHQVHMEKLAKQGWELVTVVFDPHKRTHQYYWKRSLER